MARALGQASFRGTRYVGEDLLRRCGRTESTTLRPARPIGSGPFLVERLGAWPSRSRSVRNPRVLGEASPRTSTVSSSVYHDVDAPISASRESRGSGAGRGYYTVAWRDSRPASFRRLGVMTVVLSSFQPVPLRPSGNTSRSAWSPAATRLLRSKLVRRALAFGVDRGRASYEPLLADIDREAIGSETARFPRSVSSPHYRSNWSTYRYRPAEARRLLELGGLSPWRGLMPLTSLRRGERLSASLLVAPVIPGSIRPRVVELAQAQLRRAGVDRGDTDLCPAPSVSLHSDSPERCVRRCCSSLGAQAPDTRRLKTHLRLRRVSVTPPATASAS